MVFPWSTFAVRAGALYVCAMTPRFLTWSLLLAIFSMSAVVLYLGRVSHLLASIEVFKTADNKGC